MRPKQGCYLNKRFAGYLKDWNWNNQKQLKKQSPEYCIKRANLQIVTEMFAGYLQTFPFFYGTICLQYKIRERMVENMEDNEFFMCGKIIYKKLDGGFGNGV